MNNQRNLLFYCCVPLVNDNEKITKLKPFLFLSLLILVIVVFLDFFLFETNIYYYLSFSIFPIFILVLKRFYFMYTINIIYFIVVVFPKMINDIFRFFQIEILTPNTIIILFLKFFCFILVIMAQYFFFLYYKELKFQYIIERPNKRHIIRENDDNNEKEKFVNKQGIQLSKIKNEKGDL